MAEPVEETLELSAAEVWQLHVYVPLHAWSRATCIIVAPLTFIAIAVGFETACADEGAELWLHATLRVDIN